MSFISLSPKGLEDSLACGCGMTASVKYLLKNVFFGKKIDLSLKARRALSSRLANFSFGCVSKDSKGTNRPILLLWPRHPHGVLGSHLTVSER